MNQVLWTYLLSRLLFAWVDVFLWFNSPYSELFFNSYLFNYNKQTIEQQKEVYNRENQSTNKQYHGLKLSLTALDYLPQLHKLIS